MSGTEKTIKAEIGIYKNILGYFTHEISSFGIKSFNYREIGLIGKHIRDELAKKGIKNCVLRPYKRKLGYSVSKHMSKSELEKIASNISFEQDGKKSLIVEVNTEVYVEDE